MALARRYPQPIQEQPSWQEILTADPVQPPKKVTEITMIFLAVLSISIFFAACVVVFQPFILFIHKTPYPNLAGVSLTSLLMTGGLLSLFVIYFFLRLLRRWFKRVVLVTFALLYAMMTLFFIALLGREIFLWLFYRVQIQLYWESFTRFYLSMLGL